MEIEDSPSDALLERQSTSQEIPYPNFTGNLGDDYGLGDTEIFHSGILVRVLPFDKEINHAMVDTLKGEGYRVDWFWNSSRPILKTLDFGEVETIRQKLRVLIQQQRVEIQRKMDLASSTFDKRHRV